MKSDIHIKKFSNAVVMILKMKFVKRLDSPFVSFQSLESLLLTLVSKIFKSTSVIEQTKIIWI